MPLPNIQIVGCRMIEPDRENMLLDLGMIVFLTSSASEDYEVEAHPYRDDFPHTIEIGQIVVMNRTTQQDELLNIQTTLSS